MYTPISSFEKNLLHQVKLLSLPKSDYDLFLILQANTITYQQLRITGIHGISEAGCRLSLKKLESEHLISSKLLTNKKKFYILTSKGKDRLKDILGENFIQSLRIDINRKPPTSLLQLGHRIATNDFYYQYVSAPNASIPRWNIENMYPQKDSPQAELSPRCDAVLSILNYNYFIEQDTGNQMDSALDIKLKQYMQSKLFDAEGINNNYLIFTYKSSQRKKNEIANSSNTIYRLLLKLIKLWEISESQMNKPMKFEDMVHIIKHNQSPYSTMFSVHDLSLLENLKHKHPQHVTLPEIIDLKKLYLQDDSMEENYMEQQDILFTKRKKKFFDVVKSVHGMHSKLLQGMHFFIVPNHRLSNHMPFIIPNAYYLKEKLEQLLYYCGLNQCDWTYKESYYFREEKNMLYPLLNVFSTTHQSYITFEDIVNNISGNLRAKYFLEHQHSNTALIGIVNTIEEAIEFFQEIKTGAGRPILGFINKSKIVSGNMNHNEIYQLIETTGQNFKTIPLYLEYDDYDGLLNILEEWRNK